MCFILDDRNIAVGTSTAAARIGSLCSPFIVFTVSKTCIVKLSWQSSRIGKSGYAMQLRRTGLIKSVENGASFHNNLLLLPFGAMGS